jgi:cytidylate kinase
MAVITISRQFGSGGKTLGKGVADELGYDFADNDIIQMVAEAANVSPQFVESVEQTAGSKLSKILSSMVSKSLVERVLKNERGYIDEQLYIDYLVVIIAQIAEEGNVVILGRGSQYILHDHPDAYHVLLIDELENRIKFMVKNYDLPYSKAARVVNHEDKRRMALYRKINKSDYDNPGHYHMVLNMSKMNMEQAKKMICRLIEV